jgi:hypothetical protein
MLNRLAGRVSSLHTYYRLNREAVWTLRMLRRNGYRSRPADVRLVFEDARNRFGSLRYVPWLLVYTTVRGRFVDGLIPSDLHRQLVMPAINGSVGAFSAAKSLALRLFPSPAWPDTGYLIAGVYYDRAMQPIPQPRLLDTLFGDRPELIVKSDSSRKGRNVSIIQRDPAVLDQLRSVRHGRPLVLQERILPHAAFADYAPGAATTVRLSSVREADGSIRVRAGHLRFPGTGQITVRSAEAYRCALDIPNGRFGSEFFTATWQPVTHHPESGRRFEQTPVPSFDRAVTLVCRLHALVPQLGMIGWDLMIDEQAEPRLLEWNGTAPGIALTEALSGPNYADLGWERFAPTYRR